MAGDVSYDIGIQPTVISIPILNNGDLSFIENRVVDHRTTDAGGVAVVHTAGLSLAIGTLTAKIWARLSDGSAGAFWWRSTVARWDLSANITLIGSAGQDVIPPQVDAALSTASVTLPVASGGIEVQIAGLAATTIDWLVIYEEQIYHQIG